MDIEAEVKLLEEVCEATGREIVEPEEGLTAHLEALFAGKAEAIERLGGVRRVFSVEGNMPPNVEAIGAPDTQRLPTARITYFREHPTELADDFMATAFYDKTSPGRADVRFVTDAPIPGISLYLTHHILGSIKNSQHAIKPPRKGTKLPKATLGVLAQHVKYCKELLGPFWDESSESYIADDIKEWERFFSKIGEASKGANFTGTVLVSLSPAGLAHMGHLHCDSGACFRAGGGQGNDPGKLMNSPHSMTLLAFPAEAAEVDPYELERNPNAHGVLGRAWGFMAGDRIMVGNRYAGNKMLLDGMVEEMVKQLLGEEVKPVGGGIGNAFVVSNNGSVYFNGDARAWMVGTPKTIAFCTASEALASGYTSKCDRCGTRMHRDDMYCCEDCEEHLCLDCFHEGRTSCPSCGEDFRPWLCGQCSMERYEGISCTGCGNEIHDYTGCYHHIADGPEEGTYCHGCYEDAVDARETRLAEEEEMETAGEDDDGEAEEEEEAPAPQPPGTVTINRPTAHTFTEVRWVELPEPWRRADRVFTANYTDYRPFIIPQTVNEPVPPTEDTENEANS